jgi:hypothetical protein
MPAMPGELLLVGIAQLAVVIAGFTGVTTTLTPPGGTWSPGHRIRQRAIVSTSFNVMFESLAPMVVFWWLADPHAALVVASAGVAMWTAFVVGTRARQLIRAGGLRSRGSVALFILGPLACLLFATNIIVGSLAVYALALCLQLSVAAVSFYMLVAAASD